jgi:hypothetical protein
MADMLTNTVGIMLFILIFVSLAAGGAMISKHLPREKHTEANPIWLYCSEGRIVRIDAAELGKQLEKGLPKPTFSTANEWAKKYSSLTMETDTLQISGEATAEYSGFFPPTISLRKCWQYVTRQIRVMTWLPLRIPALSLAGCLQRRIKKRSSFTSLLNQTVSHWLEDLARKWKQHLNSTTTWTFAEIMQHKLGSIQAAQVWTETNLVPRLVQALPSLCRSSNPEEAITEIFSGLWKDYTQDSAADYYTLPPIQLAEWEAVEIVEGLRGDLRILTVNQ